MEKRTYGAPRLVDWVAQVKAGAATVRVHFTGGALTTYGVTPAEYTTANPFIQRVIEQSAYFKEGRIVLLRKSVSEECKKSGSKIKCEKSAKSGSVGLKESRNGSMGNCSGEVKQNGPILEAVDFEKLDLSNYEESEFAESGGVEVTCLQDAQGYLQEKFGIPSYKVRTCEAAQRVGAEHGVKFIGGKFDSLNGEEGEKESETCG